MVSSSRGRSYGSSSSGSGSGSNSYSSSSRAYSGDGATSLAYSASSNDSETSSGSSGSEVGSGGKMTVIYECLYTKEQHKAQLHAKSTVKDLTHKLAKRTMHPSSLLRLYHHGYALEDEDATLKECGFGKHKPRVYYIYFEGGRMPHEALFQDGRLNLPAMQRYFDKGGLLEEEDALWIVKEASALLRAEPNLVEVKEPVSIIGDIHGQWFDVPAIMDAAGELGTRNHVFLGDYVDRGYFSCEVLLWVLAAKIAYPDNVTLLRGNHESRKTIKSYGSLEEFEDKYGRKFAKKVVDLFDHIPIYARIHAGGKKILAMHGGLSRDVLELRDVERIERHTEPKRDGPLNDALWSDPYEDCETGDKLKEEYDLKKLKKHKSDERPSYDDEEWHHSDRGSSIFTFGYPAVLEFLLDNDLLSIFRAHEQKETGLEQYRFGPKYEFPAVVTVFSAPNYTDNSLNLGVVATIDKGVLRFHHYGWTVHPQYYPFDSRHNEPFDRDVDTEDFIQFMHYTNPEALRKVPTANLKGEYLSIFQERALDEGEDAPPDELVLRDALGSTPAEVQKKVDTAIKSGASFQEAAVMVGKPLEKEQLNDVAKSLEAVVAKYENKNVFADALKKEAAFERDPDDPKQAEVMGGVDKREALASFAVLPALSEEGKKKEAPKPARKHKHPRKGQKNRNRKRGSRKSSAAKKKAPPPASARHRPALGGSRKKSLRERVRSAGSGKGGFSLHDLFCRHKPAPAHAG